MFKTRNSWLDDETVLPCPAIIEAHAAKQMKVKAGCVVWIYELDGLKCRAGLPGEGQDRYIVPLSMLAPVDEVSAASAMSSIAVMGHSEKGRAQFLPLSRPKTPKLDDLVLTEGMRHAAQSLLDDYGLCREQRFKRVWRHYFKEHSLPRADRPLILLSGESGTGKSLMAKAFATELKIPMVKIGPGNFSSYVSVTERIVNDLLAVTAKANGALLALIDEGDSFIRTRGQAGAMDYRESAVADFLSSLSAIEPGLNPLLVVTTNLNSDKGEIDPAILSRSRHLRFTSPRPKERLTLIKKLLDPASCSPSLSLDAYAAEPLSLREITALVEEAVKSATRRSLDRRARRRPLPLDRRDFDEALVVVKQLKKTSEARPVGFGALSR